MKSVLYSPFSFFREYRLKFKEVPIPKIKADEILVKVKSSSLNINDYERYRKKRSLLSFVIALYQGFRSHPLGGEFSGIVHSVGSQVEKYKPGDAVVGMTEGWFPSGCWAEYVVCKEYRIVSKPDFLTFSEAAVLPLSGVAAISALETCELKKEDSLLIIGASGGVGLLMLQLAKAIGCKITVICGTRNISLAYKYGADEVFDYNKISDLSNLERSFKKIIGVNGHYKMRDLSNCLEDGGVYTAVGDVRQILLTSIYVLVNSDLKNRFRISSVALSNCEKELCKLMECVCTSKVIPYLDEIYDLKDIKLGLDYILSSHAQGKVSLTVS